MDKILIQYPYDYSGDNTLYDGEMHEIIPQALFLANVEGRNLYILSYFDFSNETKVLIGMVYNFIPFMILQIYTSLSKMDRSLIVAANDLGANKVQTFLRVTLPLSVPGIISGVTLVFLPAVSSFFIPKLLGGGEYVLIGNLIENYFVATGDWNFGSAISLIMAALIIISMFVTKKIDKQTEGGK